MKKDKTIETIRSFNRFYPTNMGFLNDHAVYPGYSLAESRTLFEVYLNHGCIQNDLVNSLNIDKSYLSRVVNKLIKKGLVTKNTSKSDKRAHSLNITKKGEDEYHRLVKYSSDVLEKKIQNLSSEECEELVFALNTAMNLLSK